MTSSSAYLPKATISRTVVESPVLSVCSTFDIVYKKIYLNVFHSVSLNSYVGIGHGIKKRVFISHSASNTRKQHNKSGEGQYHQDKYDRGAF